MRNVSTCWIPLRAAFRFALLVALLAASLAAAPATQPAISLLPHPQEMKLADAWFAISQKWHLQLDASVKPHNSAAEALREDMKARHGVDLDINAASGPAIVLAIHPGEVIIGAAQDADRNALAEQAYRITLQPDEIRITANADAGLFYGAQTLVQLAQDRNGTIKLPVGQITDWPDLQRREIYWDDAHHLETLDALKHAIRQAAFFKINGFVLKLEGHFQFKSAPAVVEPYALSSTEYQSLTDYALRHHVQLIPYLDAPAHIAFILKHPEYAGLRAFADCNYELSTANPRAVMLIESMCQDLLDANKGVDRFYLSTDEPYYLGMNDAEAARMKDVGSPGKLLAEFLQVVGGYLHDRGRHVVFWGEHPLKPADVPALPPFLINGETNDPDFDAAFKARGIPQMIYASTEGEERLFPNYFLAPEDQLLHFPEKRAPRLGEAFAAIQADPARKISDVCGLLVAGWGDMGLHPETFWLGYAAMSSAGWNPSAADAQRDPAAFFDLFYGSSVPHMGDVYQLLCRQAQFWDDSWEGTPSTARKGIFGNSNTIYKPRHPAHDQTIALPPVPQQEDLGFAPAQVNEKRSRLVAMYLAENQKLEQLLDESRAQARFNRYNIEVMRSIAELCRQNLVMLQTLDAINVQLNDARIAAKDGQAAKAVAAIDAALDRVKTIGVDRDRTHKAATETWYKSWNPRVEQANGRTFLHELDDVKDHLPDRTIGMDYLVYRDLQLPLDKWASQTLSARNEYARRHGIGARN